MGRKITEIFIHCSATQPGWLAGQGVTRKREEIRAWHLQRGFNDIGYHHLIDRDGTHATGREEDVTGAHVKGHNANSIGVCLIGGFGSDASDHFSDHYTPQQRETLDKVLAALKARYPDAVIRGHNEVAAKACPGFNVRQYLGEPNSFTAKATVTKPERENLTESLTLQAGALVKAGTAATPIIAAFGDVPPVNLAILAGLAAVVLLASVVIDKERIKKWREGVR